MGNYETGCKYFHKIIKEEPVIESPPGIEASGNYNSLKVNARYLNSAPFIIEIRRQTRVSHGSRNETKRGSPVRADRER